MKHENKLKTLNEDTLKGTGFNSLGYSESSKQVKNVKRLMSTFDDTPKNEKTFKTKINVTCKKCGQKFKTKDGKLPKHETGYSYLSQDFVRNDDGTITMSKYCSGVKLIVTDHKSFIFRDVEFFVGDQVLYNIITFGNVYSTKSKITTKSATILKITHTNISDNYYDLLFENVIDSNNFIKKETHNTNNGRFLDMIKL